MITTILELAAEAGVSVPNIEDPYILRGPNAQVGRKTRWEIFEKWYVGNELHDNQLKAMPTVARIMFTDWEKKHIKDDTKLRNTILLRQSENPQSVPSKKRGDPAKPIKRMATGDLGLTVSKSAVDEDEVVKLYEIEVNKAGGEVFRCEVLKKQVTTVLTCRNLCMMRLFWPPSGSSRPTSQYLFPRLGLIHPKYEEPVKRFKAFPSKSTETYSIAEVMAWYRSVELVEDDESNVRNELEGQKHQAYLNWLAEEEERMERGRLMMVDEDKLSARLRIHTRGIEVDRDLPLGKPRYRDFVFGRRLPGQYDDLGTKTAKYSDGSGLDNEDEVQDILEKMAKESELSLQHAKELKKKQIEDRKKKEEEDRIKQEKLERDQRIEENKDRLKRIRENFENIKLQRKLQEEEKQRELLEIEQKREREEVLQQEALRHQKLMQEEYAMIEREAKLMNVEDVYHSYCREKAYDHHNMIAEDDLGRIRRDIDTKKDARYRNRIKELEEIYEEYVPFQFDSMKVRNKQFHSSNLGDGDNKEEENKERSDEEIENEIMMMMKKRGQQVPQEVDWSLFVKAQDLAHRLDDLAQDHKPYRFLEFTDNTRESLLSPIQPISAAEEAAARRVWPRGENLAEIAPPLIWSGPSLETEKKYSRLRKKSRPYTPLNPGEDQYVNLPSDTIGSLEILLSQNGIVNPLEHMGMSKSMIKSIKKGRAIPPLQESLSESQLTRFPKLRTPIPAPSPKKFQQPSFLKPLRYQSTPEALLVSSPISSSLGPPQYEVESSSHHLATPQHHPSSDILQHQTAALASLMKRKKGSKEDSNQLIQQMKADREALRAFISSSAALADDRFYLEACRPGLRSRDSINSNQIIQNYRQSLLQSFDSKPIHSGSALLSAVKESINQQHPPPMSDSMSASLLLNHNLAQTSSIDTSAQHFPGGTMEKLDPLSDEVSVNSNRQSFTQSQEISLHPTSLHPSDLILSEKNHSNLGGNRESRSEPPYEPPFSRKLFGVRGQQKKIVEQSPAFVSSELASELEKDGSPKFDTHKSKQRNEYSSLLRKTIETSRKSYNAADINFSNNRGL